MEPHVHCHGALWSPHTGMVNVHEFLYALLADAHDATLALHTRVTDARVVDDDKLLHVCCNDSWITCRRVVNAAGLQADRVARFFHDDLPFCHYFAKGHYFSYSGRPFSHLIYPVPEPGGLGIHATLSSSGTLFGPDVRWLDPEAVDLDYAPDPSRHAQFVQAIRSYYPDLEPERLHADYTGIRPKLWHPQVQSTHNRPELLDFCLWGPSQHGVPGLVHLLGMESPGLTSSLAIAEYVADQL